MAEKLLPYPDKAPERISVLFGDQKETFIVGHALTVADILDALDGVTERVFTTETHTLHGVRPDGTEQDWDKFYDLIELQDGDRFTAVPKG